MITVKVLSRKNRKPVQGARISLYFAGLSGGITDEQFTDAHGEAQFDYAP